MTTPAKPETADNPSKAEMMWDEYFNAQAQGVAYDVLAQFRDYAKSLESELSALRKRCDEGEGQLLQVGSAYASALIHLGTARKLLEQAKKKCFDRFDGCVYCGLHKDRPHDERCILVVASKDLAARPPSTTEGG